MDRQTTELLLMACPILAAVLFGALMASVIHAYRPVEGMKRMGRKAYERMRGGKSSLLDYNETKKLLEANGAPYHFGKALSDPVAWMLFRTGCAVLGAVGGSIASPWLAVALIPIGFMAPPFLLKRANKLDNEKMVPQIKTLYGTIQVQIYSGISIQSAMADIWSYFPDGRLRDGLLEFSTLLYMQSTFDEALDAFTSRFDNELIDAFCVVLRQAQESGKATELLADMQTQIDDMKHAFQLRQKEKLERTTTFCLLGVMSSAIILVLYAGLVQLYAVMEQM